MNVFGAALVVARNAAGFTQQEPAEKLRVTDVALSRYENDLRGIPDDALDAAVTSPGITRDLLITACEHRGALAVDAHMRRATAPATAWHRTEAPTESAAQSYRARAQRSEPAGGQTIPISNPFRPTRRALTAIN